MSITLEKSGLPIERATHLILGTGITLDQDPSGLPILTVDYGTGGGPITTLPDLSDVSIGGVADKDVLQYDTTTSQWVNRSLATAGIAPTVHTHAWADVSKTGSSLADLATRSAGDLSSGTLAAARLPTQAVRTDVARTITVAHTFAPTAAGVPFILGVNAQGQLVTGLNADTLDGYHASAFVLSGAFSINDLNDVSLGTLADGDRLVWNAATSQWTNQATSGGTTTVAWGDVTGKPDTATRWPDWTEVTGKPATFAPSAHTHVWADITDPPATYAPSAHVHSGADITTGTVADARLSTQVPLKNAATNTFTGNLVTTGGYIQLARTGAAAAHMYIQADAGQARQINFRSGALSRWAIAATGTAEAGANAGSDFSISRYDDAGGYLSTPFSINRSTGNATLGGAVSIIGNLTLSSGANFTVQGGSLSVTPAGGGNTLFGWGVNLDMYLTYGSAGSLTVRTYDSATTTYVTRFTVTSAGAVAWGGGSAIASSSNVSQTGHVHSAADVTSGTLPTARGGTGLSSPTAGRLLVSAGASALALLAPGAAGQVVRSDGSAWASAALAFADLSGKPTTLAGYGITDAYTQTQLQTSGQAAVHWDNLTNVPAMAGAVHTHPASDIVSGTFANARIAAGNVTQHQAALSIAWSQLTSVPATFPPSAHTHLWADITDKPATFAPSAHTHPWGDITGEPTTVAGYGITNAVITNGLSAVTSAFELRVPPLAPGIKYGGISATDVLLGKNTLTYRPNSGASAGAVVIETAVPQSSNTMVVVQIGVQIHSGTGVGYTQLRLRWYRTATAWTAASAQVYGPWRPAIQLGTNAAGNVVIILGTVGQSLSWPHLVVEEVQLAHSTLGWTYLDGWTVSRPTVDLTAYGNLTTPADAAVLSFSAVNDLPTTLAGYGITDGLTQAAADTRYAQLGAANLFSAIQRIQHTPDAVSAYHLELFQAQGAAALPIYLRFHQGSRWYRRIKADSVGFTFVAGNDDTVVPVEMGALTATTGTFSGAITQGGTAVSLAGHTHPFTEVTGSIAAAQIPAAIITSAMLRNSAAVSVIGRSAGTAGVPGDIAASTDGHVLRRSGSTLGFGTLAAGAFADNTITQARISGTIGVGKGGTGRSAVATGRLLVGTGTDTLNDLAIGGEGTVLSVVGGAVAWAAIGTSHTHAASAITGGTFASTAYTISSTGVADASLSINKGAAGAYGHISWLTNGVLRLMMANDINSDNWTLYRYSDAGAYLGGMTYNRQNGNLTVDGQAIAASFSTSGAYYLSNASIDDSATFGSLSVSGSRSTWAGIEFSASSGPMTLMVNTNGTEWGMYRIGVGWYWQVINGVLSTGTVPAAQITSGTLNTGLYVFPSGLNISAGAGLGIGFWNQMSSYSIQMSPYSDVTWGGRLDTTSDYNMYFTMSGGTNRGFVFRNSATAVAQIDGAGNFLWRGGGVGLSANYGSGKVYGSRGAYAGFEFADASSSTFMVSNTVQGFYNVGTSTWQWYFQNGALTSGTVPAARVTAGTFGAGAFTFQSTVTATGFYESSSRSLKQDIEDWKADALDLVRRVRVRQFAYKTAPSDRRVGIIAEEAEWPFTDGRGFNVADTLAVLLRGFQQLDERLAALEAP